MKTQDILKRNDYSKNLNKIVETSSIITDDFSSIEGKGNIYTISVYNDETIRKSVNKISMEVRKIARKKYKRVIGKKVSIEITRRRTLAFLVALLAMFFPFINSTIYEAINNILLHTGAYLWVEITAFYICIAITCCFIASSLKLVSFNQWIKGNKLLSSLVLSVCFLGWLILTYFISYNVVFMYFETQCIAGLISILLLSIGFYIVLALAKK